MCISAILGHGHGAEWPRVVSDSAKGSRPCEWRDNHTVIQGAPRRRPGLLRWGGQSGPEYACWYRGNSGDTIVNSVCVRRWQGVTGIPPNDETAASGLRRQVWCPRNSWKVYLARALWSCLALSAMYSAESANSLISSHGAPDSPNLSGTPIMSISTGVP